MNKLDSIIADMKQDIAHREKVLARRYAELCHSESDVAGILQDYVERLEACIDPQRGRRAGGQA